MNGTEEKRVNATATAVTTTAAPAVVANTTTSAVHHKNETTTLCSANFGTCIAATPAAAAAGNVKVPACPKDHALLSGLCPSGQECCAPSKSGRETLLVFVLVKRR